MVGNVREHKAAGTSAHASRPARPQTVGRPPPRTRRGDRKDKGIDGRVARSLRTIDHIIDALLDLLEQDGDLRPTVVQVADRAGVSRRAVYLHFDSLEALFATAAARRATEVCSSWQTPSHATPLAERIVWFTDHWAVLSEALRPLRQAGALYEPFSPQVQATFDRARRWARSAVELVFLPELSNRCAHERAPLAAALHHATSWSGWDDLHRQGVDTEQASAAMRLLLTALLGPADRMAHFCQHEADPSEAPGPRDPSGPAPPPASPWI